MKKQILSIALLLSGFLVADEVPQVNELTVTRSARVSGASRDAIVKAHQVKCRVCGEAFVEAVRDVLQAGENPHHVQHTEECAQDKKGAFDAAIEVAIEELAAHPDDQLARDTLEALYRIRFDKEFVYLSVWGRKLI